MLDTALIEFQRKKIIQFHKVERSIGGNSLEDEYIFSK